MTSDTCPAKATEAWNRPGLGAVVKTATMRPLAPWGRPRGISMAIPMLWDTYGESAPIAWVVMAMISSSVVAASKAAPNASMSSNSEVLTMPP